MSYPIAQSWKARMLLACVPVMLLLSACTPQTVYKDRIVQVPVPVQTPLRSELTTDCPPSYNYPAKGPLTVLMLMTRLDSVELALELCRDQMDDIRALQPIPQPTP